MHAWSEQCIVALPANVLLLVLLANLQKERFGEEEKQKFWVGSQGGGNSALQIKALSASARSRDVCACMIGFVGIVHCISFVHHHRQTSPHAYYRSTNDMDQ